MKENRHEARELAVSTLYALDFNNSLSTDIDWTLLPGKTEEEMAAISDDVLFFARYLVRGTLEHIGQIDQLINRYSINRPLEKINIVDRNILRMSVYSLLYNKDVHPNIVIDEAVKLSQDLSSDVTYKFINGLLDNLRKNELKENDSTQN
jgi:transcription antitermination factor NusB